PGVRNLTVTTGSEAVTLGNAFTVNAPPVPDSVAPNTGQQWLSGINLIITTQNTHFAQGVTTTSLGPDISVNSVTVNSSTNLTANVSIAGTANLGVHSITVTTGSETVTLANAFTVTS